MLATLLVLAIAGGLAFAFLRPEPIPKVPSGFFGVHTWADNPEDFAQLDSADIRSVRAVFSWAALEPTQGQNDWSSTDALMADAATHHLSVLPVLIAVPPWINANHLSAPRSPFELRHFSAFAVDVTRRYGPNGSFWAANPKIPRQPIHTYQVWNEPTLPGYWSRRPNAKQYLSLVKGTSVSVKRADPAAKIVLAGLPVSRLGGDPIDFLASIYSVRGAKSYFDGVAIHPYATEPAGVTEVLNRTRKLMRKFEDDSTPVYLTEIGWASSGPPSRFTTTEDGQKERLKAVMTTLAENRRRDKIAEVYWFTMRDRAAEANERDLWPLHTGLFSANGIAKPAWDEYKSIAGGN